VSDYLQYYTGAENLQPKSQHIYIDYLPTVEFGPGMTSATEIRKAWPTLNDRRKTALVMSLYPRTQGNAKLANTVVKMLDLAIGGETNNTEVKESTNPRIDLTPNFPNYTRLVGEFVGIKNNKLLFNIVNAELKPGVKPTEKIDRAMSNQTPIAMAVNYVKNRQVVDENDYEYRPPGISGKQLSQLRSQMRGSQPFVWLKPQHIPGSHTENELLDMGFKQSRFNTWGGTQSMWNRLAGIKEAQDYLEEKISR
jgi:hypothetical protein